MVSKLYYKKKADKYAIKLGSNCVSIMVGFARLDVNVNQSNYSVNGWYLHLNDGTLYSQDGDSNRQFTSADYNAGTIYGFKYDKKKGTITIFRGGKSLGLAYTLKDKNVAKKGILPCLNFCNQGSIVELIKFKGK